MKHTLPVLPYAYDALEPWIDARTMELHHSMHHATYVTKLNEALAKHPEIADTALPELLMHLDKVPEDIRMAVRNHGGGHWNHSFFWNCMQSPKQGAGGEPTGMIGDLVKESFADFKTLKEEFSKSALGVFGSGWAWLVHDGAKVSILTTPNQDTPISQGKKPILALDVWEHAYYLKHQNRRAEYIEAWWNVVNWGNVEKSIAG